MEARTITLKAGEPWRYLGSTPEKDAVEVVVRSFDRDVLFATGSGPSTPDGTPLTVRAGEGGRLLGLHFFVRPESTTTQSRILVRGL